MANTLTREAIALSGTIDLDADGYSFYHNIGKEPYWSIQILVEPGTAADGYCYVQGSNNRENWRDIAWQNPDGYAADSFHVVPLLGIHELINSPGLAIGYIRLRYERQANTGTLRYWVAAGK
jgi:hypothetical protein